ncbi:MAG TPA: hypothetical protein VFM94_06655 [Solirubrobacterales bacterium]|nr:hypothetical protein [Solirubrobacterales bacterium]
MLIGWLRGPDGAAHFIACDDQVGPYEVIQSPFDHYKTPWDSIMIPLPPRVFLSAESADGSAHKVIRSVTEQTPQLEWLAERLVAGKIVLRTMLATGSDYKAKVAGLTSSDEILRMIRHARLPHWVWIVEAHDKDLCEDGKPCVLAAAVFDSTSFDRSPPLDVLSVPGLVVVYPPDGGRSPFVGEDGSPELVTCAVLYLDMLGVSAMAQGARAAQELRRFDETIRGAFPYRIGAAAAEDDGEASAYPATVFSDSVVAAMPIPTAFEIPAAQAIFQLASDAALVQSELAMRGYFARGAITLDEFHFHDGLLFGPALVEAVALERQVAVDPRTVLSPSAARALQDGTRARQVEDPPAGEAPVLVDEDGLVFVDYLRGAFQIDAGTDLVAKLVRHREVVTRQLVLQASDFRRWSKYRWIAEYHNATCWAYEDELSRDPQGTFDELLVDSVHTERTFRRLP